MWIRAYQALHGFHGLVGAAELVVRPRHLIEDLVAVLVTGVLGEQPIVESDCLEWRLGRQAGISGRWDLALRGRAAFEILIGFPQAADGSRRGRVGPAGLRVREWRSGLRSGHLPRPAVHCAYPELLLELQVRETAHRLRCHRGLR